MVYRPLPPPWGRGKNEPSARKLMCTTRTVGGGDRICANLFAETEAFQSPKYGKSQQMPGKWSDRPSIRPSINSGQAPSPSSGLLGMRGWLRESFPDTLALTLSSRRRRRIEGNSLTLSSSRRMAPRKQVSAYGRGPVPGAVICIARLEGEGTWRWQGTLKLLLTQTARDATCFI